MRIGWVHGLLRAALLAVCAAPAMADSPETHVPGATWEQADPAQAGWSTDLLARAKAWAESIHASADIIVHHGRVVAEWGNVAKPMELASVRKSLLSALIGNAVARGQIHLDTPIGTLGIDDNAPSLAAAEKAATVRQLLEARSGIYHAALYETKAMAARRPSRGSHAPGTFWYYNNWDFNALGAIYLYRTGSSVFDALDREIAQPIQMQDYKVSDGMYFTGAASVYPAYTIRMSARDLARFALLYLHQGSWRDRQVVPSDWVRQSTTSYSKTGIGPGYGYLWWTGFLDTASATSSVHLPAGSYFAWGAGGQFAVVVPAVDLVVVHRIDRDVKGYRETSLRELGRLLWLVLSAAHVPDIGPDTSMTAAPGDRLDAATLTSRLSDTDYVSASTPDTAGYRAHFSADGSFTVITDVASSPPTHGTWTIRDGRYCGQVGQGAPRCYSAFADGPRLRFYGTDSLLQYDMVRAPTAP